MNGRTPMTKKEKEGLMFAIETRRRYGDIVEVLKSLSKEVTADIFLDLLREELITVDEFTKVVYQR